MFEEPRRYQTFLLTIWEERSVDPKMSPSWRFSLENIRNGERCGYSTLEALFQALRNEVEKIQVRFEDGKDGLISE